jgi:TolB-like protein
MRKPPRTFAALRATGIEVWFDQSELRGGDAWDVSIPRQIKNCASFIAAAVVALGYFVAERLIFSRRSAEIAAARQTSPQSAPATAFTPPPNSIAFLPLVNLSDDKEQEYFSDGLTEELLNSLAEIHDLQVAARPSAFSFNGTDTDIATIARKLNVGAVLEGSVRRFRRNIIDSALIKNTELLFRLAGSGGRGASSNSRARWRSPIR